jgi:hypothetical protein
MNSGIGSESRELDMIGEREPAPGEAGGWLGRRA